RETTHRPPRSGTQQDAFVLHAEILEMHNKPSMPIGERAEDAFGALPEFVDRGNRTRVLVNVGREDIDVDGIVPRDPRLVVLGASSGYLVLDASVAASDIHVGDVLDFSLNYGALLAAMTSAYVEKRCL
ncbi:MAG: alanine/ornithine racemase family PLP-dependent enzyme, partial [Gammaproteobacteria bacterium]